LVTVFLPCTIGRPKGHLVAETKLRAKVALRSSMGLRLGTPQGTWRESGRGVGVGGGALGDPGFWEM